MMNYAYEHDSHRMFLKCNKTKLSFSVLGSGG